MTTKAGERLLAQEKYNGRSFALITREDIDAIEAEVIAAVRAEVGPPPDALMDGTPAGQALREWWFRLSAAWEPDRIAGQPEDDHAPTD